MKWLKRLYNWVLGWAQSPYAIPALFILAFAESSFFPVPPDVLLIALAISIPKKSFKYATYCSIASIIGGALGYLIGLALFDTIGRGILEFYHVMDKYYWLQTQFDTYGAWFVGIAGFTPIPYKIFTITSGAVKMNFGVFMLASAISRSARFFLVGALIYRFGEPVKSFIDKYFNLLVTVFVILLVGGFILITKVF